MLNNSQDATHFIVRADKIYGTCVADSRVLAPGFLEIAGGKIARVFASAAEIPANLSVLDYGDATLVPSFIDMHCHGAAGIAFDDLTSADTAAIAPLLRAYRRQGVGRFVLSLVTADYATLLTRVANAAALCRADSSILGIHLEGPFLAQGKCGAHDPHLLQYPSADLMRELIAAAAGKLLQITLAPELPGAQAAMEVCRAAGVRVAVGHTECDYEQALAAFKSGASILTHAFNGMNGLQHRAPGPVAAAFDSADVFLEAIADGHHVHLRMLEMLFAQAPERVALISDAMAAAGMPDGEYILGKLPVVVREGLPRLQYADGSCGAIAGSTLGLLTAVNNLIAHGLPAAAVLQAAAKTPAQALGFGNKYGLLAPGYAADYLVLHTDRVGVYTLQEQRLLGKKVDLG